MAVAYNDDLAQERARRVKRALKLRARGRTYIEIGKELGVHPRTVQDYVRHPASARARAKPAKRSQQKKPESLPATSNNYKPLRGGVPRHNPNRAEMVAEAHRLQKEGLTYQQIADHFNISKSTVSGYFADPTGKLATEASRRWLRLKKGRITREEAEVKYNRMEIPISNKIRMRPVWQRRQRRIYMQDPLPPPTEEECRDAISILGNKHLQREAPALYFDAFLIFDEASQ